jgi:hypothetical protein
MKFHLTDYFQLGPFDSRHRYVRRVSNPADKTINTCDGPTLTLDAVSSGLIRWAWECNSVRIDPSGSGPTAFNTPVNAAL